MKFKNPFTSLNLKSAHQIRNEDDITGIKSPQELPYVNNLNRLKWLLPASLALLASAGSMLGGVKAASAQEVSLLDGPEVPVYDLGKLSERRENPVDDALNPDSDGIGNNAYAPGFPHNVYIPKTPENIAADYPILNNGNKNVIAADTSSVDFAPGSVLIDQSGSSLLTGFYGDDQSAQNLSATTEGIVFERPNPNFSAESKDQSLSFNYQPPELFSQVTFKEYYEEYEITSDKLLNSLKKTKSQPTDMKTVLKGFLEGYGIDENTIKEQVALNYVTDNRDYTGKITKSDINILASALLNSLNSQPGAVFEINRATANAFADSFEVAQPDESLQQEEVRERQTLPGFNSFIAMASGIERGPENPFVGQREIDLTKKAFLVGAPTVGAMWSFVGYVNRRDRLSGVVNAGQNAEYDVEYIKKPLNRNPSQGVSDANTDAKQWKTVEVKAEPVFSDSENKAGIETFIPKPQNTLKLPHTYDNTSGFRPVSPITQVANYISSPSPSFSSESNDADTEQKITQKERNRQIEGKYLELNTRDSAVLRSPRLKEVSNYSAADVKACYVNKTIRPETVAEVNELLTWCIDNDKAMPVQINDFLKLYTSDFERDFTPERVLASSTLSGAICLIAA